MKVEARQLDGLYVKGRRSVRGRCGGVWRSVRNLLIRSVAVVGVDCPRLCWVGFLGGVSDSTGRCAVAGTGVDGGLVCVGLESR